MNALHTPAPLRQLMLWGKKDGIEVFTGLILVPDNTVWTSLGQPSVYRLVDKTDIEGARVLVTPAEFEREMEQYD
jgi:hypothetical protein